MKISASLYSATNQDLPSLVHELDALNLDFFHMDCFEGSEKKLAKDIQAIQSISSTPIDLHAIGSDSAGFFQLAASCNVAQLTLQFENLEGLVDIPEDRNYSFGLAIVNDTPLAAIESYKNDLDYILLMTTTPGKSGGKFAKESFERIRLCKRLYPNLPIYVDGGINAEVSFILRLLGVSQAVSGSFLVNHKNIAAAISDLRFHQKGSNYQLKDFMQNLQDLPILDKDKSTFKSVLSTMEEYKLGFVLYEDGNGFCGITSNADLRKGILKNVDHLDQIPIDDLINATPIVISEEASTYEMISLIKSYNFPILFLPVVDAHKDLKGVITFNELIKGEG